MDVEYILRIVLRARDEIAGALVKARTELAAFGDEADRVNSRLDPLNKNVTSLSRRISTLQGRLQGLRGDLKDLASQNSAATKSSSDLANAHQRLSRLEGEHATTLKNLNRAQADYTRISRQVSQASGPELTALRAKRQALREELTTRRALHSAVQGDLQNARQEISQLRNLGKEHRTTAHGVNDLERVMGALERRFGGVSRSSGGASGGIRNVGRSARQAEQEGTKFLGFLDAVAKRSDHAASRVARLDNTFRGFIFLAVIAFAQQLVTVLDAAAGEAGSLASSATFAAGAVGGTLVAGIAQAIPIIGLLVLSLHRVTQVMQAVQQQNLANRQAFARQGRDNTQAASSADAIANAQDGIRTAEEGLAQAHRNVTAAQKQLTDANLAAQRQYEDLISTVQRSSLGQRDARIALQHAIATGGDVASAQLDLADANRSHARSVQDLQRLRSQRGGPVQGSDQVVAATQQLHDATRGVGDAQRALDRAHRSLGQAERSAANATKQTGYAANNLKYMLSQLDPTERRLFQAITNLQKVYRQNFRIISDQIVGSVTHGVNRATQLLKDPRIFGAFLGLSHDVSTGMNRIINAATGPRAIAGFLRIIQQSRQNIRPLTTDTIHLGRAFENIAIEAGPALHDFILFLGRQIDRFLKITDNQGRMTRFFSTGEHHLEAWIKLLEAVVGLWLAFTGAGQAQGMRNLQDMTAAINNAAGWVRTHVAEVQHFLAQSHAVMVDLWHVVLALAKAMIGAFNPASTKALAQFLIDVVIPALTLAIIAVGKLTHAVLTFLDLPFVSEVVKWGFVIGATLFTANKFVRLILSSAAPLARTIRVIGGLRAAYAALAGEKGIKGAIDAYNKFITESGKKPKQQLAIEEGGATAGESMGTAIRTAGAAVAEEMAAAIRGGGTAAGEQMALFEERGAVKAGATIEAAEVAGGKVAAEEIAAGETAGGATAAEEIGAATAAGGATGLLGRIGGSAGLGVLLSRFLRGGAIGLGTGLGLNFLGQQIGGGAGKQISGGAGLAGIGAGVGSFFGPAGAAVGAAGGELANMVVNPDKIGFSAGKVKDAIDKLNAAIKDGDPRKMKEMANNLDHFVFEADIPADKRHKLEAWSDQVRKTADDINYAIKQAPKARAIDFTIAINQDPKNFKNITQGFLRSIQAMPIQAKTQAIHAAESYIDGLASRNPKLKHTADQIDHILNQSLARARDHATHRAAETASNVAAGLQALYSVALSMSGGFVTQVNKVLDSLGVNKKLAVSWAKFGSQFLPGGIGQTIGALEKLGGGPGGASGGIFSGAGFVGKKGERSGDTVMAPWLARGEAVLNWAHQRVVEPAVRAFYGFGLDGVFQRTRGLHGGTIADQRGYAGGGVVVQPGVNMRVGMEPRILGALNKLSEILNQVVYVISGYRSPQHSVAVGGFPDDPHTRGQAADIGIGSALRSSMTSISESMLRRVGLYRPFYPQSAAEVNHVQLIAGAAGRAITNVAAAVDTHLKRIVLPGTGAVRDISQATLDRVHRAAQRYLNRQVLKERDQGGLVSGLSGTIDNSVVSTIAAVWRRLHLGGKYLLSAMMTGLDESGLRNLPRGSGSSVGWRQEISSYGSVAERMNVAHAADRYFSEARQHDHGQSAGQLSYDVQRPLGYPDPGRNPYNRFRAEAMKILHHLGVKGFARGGEIDGPMGAARMILAHAKEWIINPRQQGMLAKMLGMSRDTLRSVLGFTGSPAGAAGGLEVNPFLHPLGFDSPFRTFKLDDLSTDMFAPVRAVLNQIKHFNRRAKNWSSKVGKQLGELTAQDGAFDNLATAIDTFTKNLDLGLIHATFRITKSKEVIKRLSDQQIAARALNNLVKEYDKLVGERGELNAALKDAQRELRRAHTTAQRNVAKGLISNIKGRLQTLDEQITQNIQDRFQAQVDAINTAVTSITTQAGAAQAGFGGHAIAGHTLRGATALGLTGVVTQFHQAAIGSMNQEIIDLTEQMKHAHAIGATDVEQQIQDQINDVNNAAQFQTTRINVQQRIAQARAAISGNALAGITAQMSALQQSAPILANQRSQLVSILGFDPAGQQLDFSQLTTVQQALVGQIDDLDATMAENTAQIVELNATYRQTATQQIQNQIGSQTTFTGAAADIITKLQQISGVVDPTQLKQIAAIQQANLEQNAKDIGNNIAQAMVQSDLFSPQANTALGNLMAAFQEGPQSFATALANMTPLLAQIEAGMPDSTRQVFEQLIQSMIDNTSSTLDNTQQINQLNGTFTQPQGFSSSAWQWFRNAIFTGMGGILPQFQVPAAMTTPVVTTATTTGAGATLAPITTQFGGLNDGPITKQEFNFEINEAGGPIDTTELGATVAWAAKTAQ
jgi:hypothetical protein